MSKKILIVDDEENIVEMLKLRLESAGFEVITASDGHEGLERARSERPDLILMDVMMPKMDGYQACRMLKFDDQFKDIPIIMLTARAQESDVKTGKDTGADAYITKPFDQKELIGKINELLSA